MKLIVYVTEQDEQIILDKLSGQSAELITEESWATQQNKLPEIAYTGIKEFNNKEIFLKVLSAADTIYYQSEADKNFDIEAPTSTDKGYTDYLLLLVNNHKTIENFNLSGKVQVDQSLKTYLHLQDCRNSKTNQLWAAGCSFTYGEGVSATERYIHLVANELDMPVSCLAAPATSIEWSADQILRSDIRAGDIVIWGLTDPHRHTWCVDNTLINVTIQKYNYHKSLESVYPKRLLLNSSQNTYNLITHINQVRNFCNKVGAKLVLFGLLTTGQDCWYLRDIPEFYQYYYSGNDYVDHGSDGEHPGPNQHKLYAEFLLSILNNPIDKKLF